MKRNNYVNSSSNAKQVQQQYGSNNNPMEDTVMPLLNIKNTPILSKRPMSSYTRLQQTGTSNNNYYQQNSASQISTMAQSTNSNQFMSGIKKRMPPSQALYSIQDQLEDLRHKELDLEKAKLDFFKKAEEHRFQQDLQQAKKDHEEQILLIKTQNENNTKLLSQQHQKEVNMLISSQRLEMERVRETNQEYVSELLNRIDYLEGELKRRTKDLSGKHEIQINDLKLQCQQELRNSVQELQLQLHQQYDEQLAAQKLKISRKFKNQRDQQVKEVVEKMQEETFAELNKQQSAAENGDQSQNQQQTVIVVQQKEESNELMIVKLDNQAQTEFESHSISLQTDPVQDDKDMLIQELRQQLNDLQQQLEIHHNHTNKHSNKYNSSHSKLLSRLLNILNN
eukprot:403356532